MESKRATPYYKSKTLAERAAWAFSEERSLPLVVINPGLILGPLIGNDFGSSVGLVWQLMNGRFTKLPRYGCSIVDVRDVAMAHVLAMTEPTAAGHRFIVGGWGFSMKNLSLTLAQFFPEHTSRLPTAELPDWFVRIIALIDTDTRRSSINSGATSASITRRLEACWDGFRVRERRRSGTALKA